MDEGREEKRDKASLARISSNPGQTALQFEYYFSRVFRKRLETVRRARSTAVDCSEWYTHITQREIISKTLPFWVWIDFQGWTNTNLPKHTELRFQHLKIYLKKYLNKKKIYDKKKNSGLKRLVRICRRNSMRLHSLKNSEICTFNTLFNVLFFFINNKFRYLNTHVFIRKNV